MRDAPCPLTHVSPIGVFPVNVVCGFGKYIDFDLL